MKVWNEMEVKFAWDGEQKDKEFSCKRIEEQPA